MITRTAFTQLGFSLALLLLVTALMMLVFGGPAIVLWNHPDLIGVSIGAGGVLLMLAAFRPVQRWYGLPAGWLLTLPLAAVLYLGMTWGSALSFWRGTRAQWKGRSYAVD